MDWLDFLPKMVSAIAMLVMALTALARVKTANAEKSKSVRVGEKTNSNDPAKHIRQLTRASDPSTWKSPWQRMTALEKFAFILDQLMVFGGMAGLLVFTVLFKGEPLTTQTGAVLVTLGAVVVIGSLRR